MNRLRCGGLVLGFALLVVASTAGQDKKPDKDDPKPKGTLPANWKKLGLTDDQKEQFVGEDGTPYPPARERRNVGNFYKPLAQRTIGTGGCTASEPRTHYGKLLGMTFDPLPEATPPGYEILRTHANAWLAKGGVVGIKCTGGKGGLAVVYTRTDKPDRPYDLITIYDD